MTFVAIATKQSCVEKFYVMLIQITLPMSSQSLWGIA